MLHSFDGLDEIKAEDWGGEDGALEAEVKAAPTSGDEDTEEPSSAFLELREALVEKSSWRASGGNLKWR